MKQKNEKLEQQNKLIIEQSVNFINDTTTIRLCNVLTILSEEQIKEAFQIDKKHSLITPDFSIQKLVNEYIANDESLQKTGIKKNLDVENSIIFSVANVIELIDKFNLDLIEFNQLYFLKQIYKHRQSEFIKTFNDCLISIKNDVINYSNKFNQLQYQNDSDIVLIFEANVKNNVNVFINWLMETGKELIEDGIDIDLKNENVVATKTKKIGHIFAKAVFKKTYEKKRNEKNEQTIQSIAGYFTTFQEILKNYFLMSIKHNAYITDKTTDEVLESDAAINNSFIRFIRIQNEKVKDVLNNASDSDDSKIKLKDSYTIKENELFLKAFDDSLSITKQILTRFDFEELETKVKNSIK